MSGHVNRWAVLALLLIADSMNLLDTTVVNVAAPTIHADLHAGSSALQWIIGGYALSFAMGLLLAARLGDIYGRRRLFIIGTLGFVASSGLCALALDPSMLIAARMLEGASAAVVIPQTLGIVHSMFGEEERQGALAVFAPVIAGSAVLGPILGGALIAANLFDTGWRLIFVINIPLGLIAAAGAARLMPESRAERRPSLDLVGAALGALGMGLLIYPLIEGRQVGWPAWIYAMIIASLAVFGLLVRWILRTERSGRDPFIETGIFAHRQYTTGLGAVLAFFTLMMGTLLVITLFVQLGERYSPIRGGLAIAPLALGLALGAILAAAVLAPRLGRAVLQLGTIILAGALWWLRATVAKHGLHATPVELVGPEILVGLGLGMLIGPLFDFILAAVSSDQVGSGAGVLEAVQQLAGALGVAVIGTVFFAALRHGYVAALKESLLIELAATPVLFLLMSALPPRATRSQAHLAEPETKRAPRPASRRVGQALSRG